MAVLDDLNCIPHRFAYTYCLSPSKVWKLATDTSQISATQQWETREPDSLQTLDRKAMETSFDEVSYPKHIDFWTGTSALQSYVYDRNHIRMMYWVPL